MSAHQVNDDNFDVDMAFDDDDDIMSGLGLLSANLLTQSWLE